MQNFKDSPIQELSLEKINDKIKEIDENINQMVYKLKEPYMVDSPQGQSPYANLKKGVSING